MINEIENIYIFTENFTDLFISTGLGKTKFANQVGLKHSQIEHYLNGTIPTTNSVVKICDYFNCSIDYIVGLSNMFCYPNLTKGFSRNSFYPEYSNLSKANHTNHFKLAKNNLVTESSLSLWKQGGLPKFEVLIAIAYELSGSIDRMLGRIPSWQIQGNI